MSTYGLACMLQILIVKECLKYQINLEEKRIPDLGFSFSYGVTIEDLKIKFLCRDNYTTLIDSNSSPATVTEFHYSNPDFIRDFMKAVVDIIEKR